MRFIRVTSAAGICLFFGTMVPVYAQGDQKGDSGKQERTAPQHAKQQPQRAQQPQQQQQRQQQPQRAQQPQQQRHTAAATRSTAAATTATATAAATRSAELPTAQCNAHSSRRDRGSSSKAGCSTAAGRDMIPGRTIAPKTGNPNIEPGRNAEATAVTTSLRPVSVSISAGSISSASTRCPVIYMGYPRFSYGGFSFLLLDPWPEYWPENWYDSDDLYIDYDDGYYLYNRRYPQVRLAVTVAL